MFFASAMFADFFNDPFFHVGGNSPLQSPQWTTFDTFPSGRRHQPNDDWRAGLPPPDSVVPKEDHRLTLWKPTKQEAVPVHQVKVKVVDDQQRRTAQRKQAPQRARQPPPPPLVLRSPMLVSRDSASAEPLQCLPVLPGPSPRRRTNRQTELWAATLRKPNVKRNPGTRRNGPASPERKHDADTTSPATDGVATSEPELLALIRSEVLSTDPGISWDDVAGLDGARDALREATVLPLRLPEYFAGIRRPCRALLLAGPPGTGKTLLVRALATECRGQFTFFNVSSSTLTSRWRGDSEKLVRLLFAEARSRAPSIIFIDEVDALCSARGSPTEHEASRRFKAELLVAMDGLLSDAGGGAKAPHVLLVAATNHPWDLDDAFLRRFERRLYVPLPDEPSRRRLAELCLRGVTSAEGVDAAGDVAAGSAGYSGADVAAVCRAAAMGALRRRVRLEGVDAVARLSPDSLRQPLTQDDVRAALRAARPAGRAAPLRRYRAWADKFATD